jgi:hypothetical protein
MPGGHEGAGVLLGQGNVAAAQRHAVGTGGCSAASAAQRGQDWDRVAWCSLGEQVQDQADEQHGLAGAGVAEQHQPAGRDAGQAIGQVVVGAGELGGAGRPACLRNASGDANALMPVISRPTISDWIASLPSSVYTASMSAWCLATW